MGGLIILVAHAPSVGYTNITVILMYMYYSNNTYSRSGGGAVTSIVSRSLTHCIECCVVLSVIRILTDTWIKGMYIYRNR